MVGCRPIVEAGLTTYSTTARRKTARDRSEAVESSVEELQVE
jgi:hypothetical protein